VHFADSAEALQWFQEKPIRGAFILMKGSRGTRLEKLRDAL
jgi:UDP-N-acetylmuramyl pentapeptide synthase